MKLQNALLMTLSLILLANCTETPKTISVPELVPIAPTIVDRPDPVYLNDIDFYVVSDKNIDQFLAGFKSVEREITFVAITIDDYEKMALNIAELRRYINEQKRIIIYYESAIAEQKRIVEEKNSQLKS